MKKFHYSYEKIFNGETKAVPLCEVPKSPIVYLSSDWNQVSCSRCIRGKEWKLGAKHGLPQAFWKQIEKTDSCWLWTGYTDNGYGRWAGIGAHRVLYIAINGRPEKGMELDHLCRNRRCVNPDHLEPVTKRENILRGICPAAKNRRKTNCPKGHEYAGENLYVSPKGFRYCVACHNAKREAAKRARIHRLVT